MVDIPWNKETSGGIMVNKLDYQAFTSEPEFN